MCFAFLLLLQSIECRCKLPSTLFAWNFRLTSVMIRSWVYNQYAYNKQWLLCLGDLLESCSQHCMGCSAVATCHCSVCNPQQVQSSPPYPNNIRSVTMLKLPAMIHCCCKMWHWLYPVIPTIRMPVPLHKCKGHLLFNPAVWGDRLGRVPELQVLHGWEARICS